MQALNELKRLIDEKLVGTKADHIQAERLVAVIRQQLEPPKPEQADDTRKS